MGSALRALRGSRCLWNECPVFAVRCTWVNGILAYLCIFPCKKTSHNLQYISIHFTFRSHHILTSYHFIQGTHWANQKTGLSACAKLLGSEMDTSIASQQKKNTSESVNEKAGGSPNQTIELSFVVPVAHGLWGNHLCAAHEASAGLCNLIAFLRLD